MSAVPSGMTTTGRGRFGVTSASSGGSLGRVGEREAVRERAALEHGAELVRPPRPRVADDADGVRRDALALRPLEQEARDRLVESLVRRRERADDVVIDVAVDDRLGDRVARGRVAPLPPADQERALRVRVHVPRIGEECRAGSPGQDRRREHERDRCPVLGERLESGTRLRRGARGTRPRSRARNARAARARPRAGPLRPRRRRTARAGAWPADATQPQGARRPHRSPIAVCRESWLSSQTWRSRVPSARPGVIPGVEAGDHGDETGWRPFAKGAALEDPSGLFNSSLDGSTRRAIDFHEGKRIDEEALKTRPRHRRPEHVQGPRLIRRSSSPVWTAAGDALPRSGPVGPA